VAAKGIVDNRHGVDVRGRSGSGSFIGVGGTSGDGVGDSTGGASGDVGSAGAATDFGTLAGLVAMLATNR
jgi:hypothetical protein